MTTLKKFIQSDVLLLVLFACCGAGLQVHGYADAEKRREEFQRFANHLPDRMQRYAASLDNTTGKKVPVEPDLLERAIQTSAAWIKTVLKDEYVPDDIERQIEAVPAGMEGDDLQGNVGVGPRFDCTMVEFQSKEFHFRVVQDSMAILFFVSPNDPDPAAASATPEELGRGLRDKTNDLFRHAAVGQYMRAIRITDFGVDLTLAQGARYPDENHPRRWKPTILVPPKACEDGVITPSGELHYDALAKKLREIDPAIPANQIEHFSNDLWWGLVYAATDGNTLIYRVTKAVGGQMPVGHIPAWFRVVDPAEEGKANPKWGTTRLTAPAPPPG